MGEFIVAHKLALFLIGAALGGFILLTRNKGAQAANGIPVNPYNANSPSSDGGGGFDISSLLPAGPAGPALDPSGSAPGAGTSGEAPAAVDNAPATPSFQDAQQSPPGTVVEPSGTGSPFTGGRPGGVTSTDPEHNAYVYGVTDVDPFNVQPSAPPPDAVDRYLANQNTATRSVATSTGPGTAPTVSLPLTPMPTVGHAVAV